MAKIDMQFLLEKYGDIIKEEVNIKDISSFADKLNIKKIYKPVGSKISAKFGKDTGNIIKYGKEGQITTWENGEVTIADPEGNTWTLAADEYEIAYEGLEGDQYAVDGDIIAKLNLEITPQLKKEGVAREISRFLNQMRKDADYAVDTKVQLLHNTQDEYLIGVLNEFADFFKAEALVKWLEKSDNPEGDIVALFTSENSTINFALRK
jgi:isoleucyl-tRNA synthetase